MRAESSAMRSPSATTSAWRPSGHQGRGAGASLSGTMESAGCRGGAGASGAVSGCMPHRNPLILSGLYSRERPERAVGRQIPVSRSASCNLRALRGVRGRSSSRPGNHASRLREAVKQKTQSGPLFECVESRRGRCRDRQARALCRGARPPTRRRRARCRRADRTGASRLVRRAPRRSAAALRARAATPSSTTGCQPAALRHASIASRNGAVSIPRPARSSSATAPPDLELAR